jgi:hypothetical protein
VVLFSCFDFVFCVWIPGRLDIPIFFMFTTMLGFVLDTLGYPVYDMLDIFSLLFKFERCTSISRLISVSE